MASPIGAGLMLAPPFWQFQTMALLDQDPPVTGVFYPALEPTHNVLVRKAAFRQVNDETDGKNIQILITVDGVAVIEGVGGWTAANNTWYSIRFDRTMNAVDATGDDTILDLYGKSVEIEVKLGTAVGTNQELDARVVYFKML